MKRIKLKKRINEEKKIKLIYRSRYLNSNNKKELRMKELKERIENKRKNRALRKELSIEGIERKKELKIE